MDLLLIYAFATKKYEGPQKEMTLGSSRANLLRIKLGLLLLLLKSPNLLLDCLDTSTLISLSMLCVILAGFVCGHIR